MGTEMVSYLAFLMLVEAHRKYIVR